MDDPCVFCHEHPFSRLTRRDDARPGPLGPTGEIYAQRLPVGGEKIRVSTAGAAQPRWRRDGQRFIVNQITEGEAPPPITVIVNWPALLKKGGDLSTAAPKFRLLTSKF